jgi:hypothetical protein
MSLPQIRTFALVSAFGLSLLSAGTAAAQTRPSVPIDARGYQTTVAYQEYYQSRAAGVAHAPVYLGHASPQTPHNVTIVSPSGTQRRFPIEGPVTVVPSPNQASTAR